MEKRIICNCCGTAIGTEKDLVTQDYLYIKKEWGYFSRKDGVVQEFRLCEACYDEWIKNFQIPVHTIEATELV